MAIQLRGQDRIPMAALHGCRVYWPSTDRDPHETSDNFEAAFRKIATAVRPNATGFELAFRSVVVGLLHDTAEPTEPPAVYVEIAGRTTTHFQVQLTPKQTRALALMMLEAADTAADEE